MGDELPGVDRHRRGRGRPGGPDHELPPGSGRSRARGPRPSRDARWRLAGSLGRVPARVARAGRPGCPDSPTTARNRTSYLHRDEVIARIAGYADGDRGAGPARDQGRAADRGRLERRSVPPRDRRAARSGHATSSWPRARSTRRRSRRRPRPLPRGSTSSTPTTIATPISSRLAASCWSDPARRVASWPRNCRRPGAT